VTRPAILVDHAVPAPVVKLLNSVFDASARFIPARRRAATDTAVLAEADTRGCVGFLTTDHGQRDGATQEQEIRHALSQHDLTYLRLMNPRWPRESATTTEAVAMQAAAAMSALPAALRRLRPGRWIDLSALGIPAVEYDPPIESSTVDEFSLYEHPPATVYCSGNFSPAVLHFYADIFVGEATIKPIPDIYSLRQVEIGDETTVYISTNCRHSTALNRYVSAVELLATQPPEASRKPLRSWVCAHTRTQAAHHRTPTRDHAVLGQAVLVAIVPWLLRAARHGITGRFDVPAPVDRERVRDRRV